MRAVIKNLDKIIFALAIVGLVFACGMAVGRYKLFPNQMVDSAEEAARDLRRHWKSYASIEPTKFLYPARHDGDGVTVYHPERASNGLTFMTGLFNGQVSLQIIDMQGEVVHRWIPDFKQISRENNYRIPSGDYPFNAWDTEIHGAYPLPDGSVVFVYTNNFLTKLDKCSNLLWMFPYGAHHSLFASEDGTFWLSGRNYVRNGETGKTPPRITPPFYDETALQVSAAGEILREIPLTKLIIDNGMEGLLFPLGTGKVENPQADFMHLNDVETLQSADAAGFPMFETGDVMVSVRNLNLIFVFDPDTLKIKWHQTGPWQMQHDPDFRHDGTISVFNNRWDGTQAGSIFGGSNIMVVDPATGDTQVIYSGTSGKSFYTRHMGKHQALPNGSILISEAYGGRAFEIDDEGEIVWEYMNRYDAERVAQMEEATRLPDKYFTVDDWTCD